MNDCLFCKIIVGDIPSEKLYENENIFAFLDINPVNPGHTLVIPKIHTKNLYDISDETLCDVAKTLKRLSIAIKKALGADGINIEMNNDAPAGQVIFHTHIHIVPRFRGDGFKHWSGTPYEEREEWETGEKIRNAL